MPRIQFLEPFASLIPLACVAVCTLSCSVVIDTKTKQCSVDADCTSLGKAFADTVCDTQHNVCVGKSGALGCVEAPNSTNDTVELSFDIEFLTAPQDPKPTVVRVWPLG